MKKLKFVASLPAQDTDYQVEQAATAERTALRLGVEIEVVSAGNDRSLQSQQVLNAIQMDPRPDGILVEPVGGTTLPNAARAAASAGIGWVILNRDVDYLAEIRRASLTPAFGVTSDQEEIGRIQGRQLAALLPEGGSVLYITGPSESLVAKQRTVGVHETRRAEVQVRVLKARWTESSAHRAVSSWLRLSTSQRAQIDLIAAQNDAMAMGARRAFQELQEGPARDRWLSLPFLGCDGLPRGGQAWVEQGLLTATVVVPPNIGHGLELLVNALTRTAEPLERNLTEPSSFPALEVLAEDSCQARCAGA